MARLIDSDALMDVIRQHEYRLATKQGSVDYGMFTPGIQQVVDEQPTIDAVPVVRCRYCKKHCEANGKHYCKFWRMYCPDDSDFFCKAGEKAGERKEGIDNGC